MNWRGNGKPDESRAYCVQHYAFSALNLYYLAFYCLSWKYFWSKNEVSFVRVTAVDGLQDGEWPKLIWIILFFQSSATSILGSPGAILQSLRPWSGRKSWKYNHHHNVCCNFDLPHFFFLFNILIIFTACQNRRNQYSSAHCWHIFVVRIPIMLVLGLKHTSMPAPSY